MVAVSKTVSMTGVNPLAKIDDRLTAYEAAGQVAMFFFHGLRRDVQQVEVGKGKFTIVTKAPNPEWIANNKNRGPRATAITKRATMTDLAAMVTICAIMEEKGVLQERKILERIAASPIGESATALFGDSAKRREAFLRRMARWTYEAIDNSKMWPVIDSLAAKLIEKKKLDGRQAWRIMQRAYAGSVPVRELGHVWRRRFPEA